MSVTVGSAAPAFKLASHPGHEVDISTVIGHRKVVLLFFPLAFSSVCTTEMCTFRDDWQQWKGLGCDVFGISVDSPFVTDKFRQDLSIPFEILSDFNKDVSRSYGALYENLMGLKGVGKRAAFVIDATGKVVYAKVNDEAGHQVDFAAIRKAVESC
ncbi:MAG: redoxin domain-containing protein [Planctomycetota bacterium]